jgi:hypothetical protein
MSRKILLKDTKKIAKISTIIIFLALIRCISETFRLHYYAPATLTFEEIKPFLMGALLTSIALLAMNILFYFGKYKMIIATCILTIIALLILKYIYLIP